MTDRDSAERCSGGRHQRERGFLVNAVSRIYIVEITTSPTELGGSMEEEKVHRVRRRRRRTEFREETVHGCVQMALGG
jgi:hypothetical protein